MDIVDSLTRSRMMAGITGRNTKPELLVRQQLYGRGFRFSRSTKLPGRPDLVLPRWRVAIFVHGCFWHLHDCHLSKFPSSNQAFWRNKLTTNRDRDDLVLLKLLALDWRVAIVWECALRGGLAKTQLENRMDYLANWIRCCNLAFPAIEIPTTC